MYIYEETNFVDSSAEKEEKDAFLNKISSVAGFQFWLKSESLGVKGAHAATVISIMLKEQT
jgi:hypothetical protein